MFSFTRAKRSGNGVVVCIRMIDDQTTTSVVIRSSTVLFIKNFDS